MRKMEIEFAIVVYFKKPVKVVWKDWPIEYFKCRRIDIEKDNSLALHGEKSIVVPLDNIQVIHLDTNVETYSAKEKGEWG